MMKKPLRRNNNDSGSLFGGNSAAMSSPSRQEFRTLAHHHRQQQRGGSSNNNSMRLRNAMTLLSILTIVMATFMIITATSTTVSHKESAASAVLTHPDDRLSPLAHALSSSRRRNLSQLLPEEDNSNNKKKKTTNGFKNGKDDDEAQIRKRFQQRQEKKQEQEKQQHQQQKLQKQKEQPQQVNKQQDDSEQQVPKRLRPDDTKRQTHEIRIPPIDDNNKGNAKKSKDDGVSVTKNQQEKGSTNSNRDDASPTNVTVESNETNGGGHVKAMVVELKNDASLENATIDANATEAIFKKMKDMIGKLPPQKQQQPKFDVTTIKRKDGITSTIITGTQFASPIFQTSSTGRAKVRKPFQAAMQGVQGQMYQAIQQLEGRGGGEDEDGVTTDSTTIDLVDPFDPLQHNDSSFYDNLTSIDIYPKTPYLGVLVDAGRHYFPIVWLKKLLRYLHAMNYNLVHFRLTDDQTFNINLTSYPQLASPVTFNNPDHLVYSKEELLDLVQFAERLNITIMPEINVPGHAGSWAGIPGLVVNCPEFVCQKGYGVPLNVTHPELPNILTNIFREVREIFYTSPYLHLGGDEVNMGMPCFDELGAPLFDYEQFENMLKGVLNSLNISNDKVLRWEMTGQQIGERAGKMIHFWESDPGQKMNATGPYFVSNGLYFDTNGRDRAYDVYTKTSKQLHLDWTPYLQAIVVGTFELNPDFWFQRNVIGRLIGVAMGASGKTYNQFSNFTTDYMKYCRQLQIDERVCNFRGLPILEQHEYYANWQGAWTVWKHGICERLTYPKQSRAMLPVYNWRQQMMEQVNREFWTHFAREHRVDQNGTSVRQRIKPPHYNINNISIPAQVMPIRQHAIQHTGVILDLVNAFVQVPQLEEIIDQLAVLGFNLIQLRLADDYGYAMAIPISQGNRLEFRGGKYAGMISYDRHSLARIVDYAERQGKIEVMPEISISTNAGGWYRVGFGLSCPSVICESGRGVANDITDPDLLPVVSSIVRDFRKIFSSEFIHLGADERYQSVRCFKESGKSTSFNVFERKLNALLELEGVNLHNVLRWENQEQKRYRGRTGRITHFRHLRQNSTKVRSPDKGEPFFANVDIFKGNAWAIYLKTREMVQMKPLGLMAEVRLVLAWHDRRTFGRLLAFAMGASTLPEWSNATLFRDDFTNYCQAAVKALTGRMKLDDCTWFEDDQQPWEVDVESEDFRVQSCNAQTFVMTRRFARTNITAY